MFVPRKQVRGVHWPETIRVTVESVAAGGAALVVGAGESTGRHHELILPEEAWTQTEGALWQPGFGAHAAEYRLAMEGVRLRLAFSCDPLLATNNAAIDLLPHQMEAVYSFMLPQPVVRHLMAHDAGAGKTVMCGLLYKELRMRQPDLRTLIVAPAALVAQWQREMQEKFFERFEVIDRNALRREPEVWTRTQQAITSVSFASQVEIRATLAAVPWDLVFVDEAHHMAAYDTHETQAYALGSILSRRAKHLVLATATPHKGDAVNFTKLLQLLDSGISEPTVIRPADGAQPGTPLMLRRLKEEMLGFDGQPLFLPREVETRWYLLRDSELEWKLYRALTEYVSQTYRAAEKVGGQTRVNVQFAMTILQRRMASSLAALERSLQRRRSALMEGTDSGGPGQSHDLTDAPEEQRWEVEARVETATPARTRRERRREVQQIDALLEDVAAVLQQSPETKLLKLQEVMAEAGVEPGNDERLLVFTEFLDTLRFLRERFEAWGYTVTQIDGSMPQPERLRAERDFRDRSQVMVATEAAGEGINLQFCARMVNYDLPWVPTRLEQRMGRIHRYGQQRVARIYNLGAGDTREGYVLKGLMERLDTMRMDMGDRVFDVISELVADTDMEALLSRVAVLPTEEGGQYQVLEKLVHATEQGAERYRQTESQRQPLNPRVYDDLREASRFFRLTPEYAQHFIVDVLRTLGEEPEAWPDGSEEPDGSAEPGDAQVFQVTAQRRVTAECLGVRQGETVRLTFDRSAANDTPRPRLLALGSPVLDRFLALAQENWGPALQAGAVFWDGSLPTGDGYLVWHLRGRVVDGQSRTVTESLFAVRQNADTIEPVAPAALIDLMPAPTRHELPPWMVALSRDPATAWEWSLEHQLLPWLERETGRRGSTVEARRSALLGEAQTALERADQVYQEAVFGEGGDGVEAEALLQAAQRRVRDLNVELDREEACALAWPEIVGVAAVLPLAEAPVEEMRDLRPEVAEAAVQAVRAYEEAHGRTVTDVSGEHQEHPYDLHSTGPGGLRCIEVKGTTTGRIFMSENERRASQRLRTSYYLYIVTDPLDQAQVHVIRDPFKRLDPDRLERYSVQYQYSAAIWQAAVEEGNP